MKYPKINILLGLLLFAITACQPQDGALPFETIAQEDVINYREESPTLFVIANNDDVDALVPNVLAEDPTLADQLRQMDYDRFFTILVLQGLKHQGGYNVTIQRIVRQDGRVNVYAEFISPKPGTFRYQAFTSPYHLVAVSKRGEWGQQIPFVLVADSEDVAETSHFIP